MANEPDAVEDDDFDPVCLFIHACGILTDRRFDLVRGNEHIVIDPWRPTNDLLQRTVDVIPRNPLGLHLVDCDNPIIVNETDFYITQRPGLFIRSEVSS